MNTEECGSLLECCWKHWSPVTCSQQEESWTPGRESRVCIWWRPWHSDVSDSSSSRSSSTSTITRCTGREEWWWVWAARAKGWYWTLAHWECWSAQVESPAPSDQQRWLHTRVYFWLQNKLCLLTSSAAPVKGWDDQLIPAKWGLAPLFNIWNNQLKYEFSYVNLNSFNHFTFSQFNWRHLWQLSGASDRGHSVSQYSPALRPVTSESGNKNILHKRLLKDWSLVLICYEDAAATNWNLLKYSSFVMHWFSCLPPHV